MPILIRSRRRAPAAVRQAAPASTRGELPFGLPRPPAGTVQKPAGVTLCMIVKNEQRFLAQCLRSVQDVVDEMIVVDTGSTDDTIAIAKSFGATVIERAWRNDFAWARNQALEAATKRWILVLDADEELMPGSKPYVQQIKDIPAEHTALWTRLYNRSDDYQGTGEMSHALIRIFPNDPRIRYRGMIHEFATLDEDPNGLNGKLTPIGIVHHGYMKEIVEERGKGERNLEIVRAAAEKEPDEPYHWFNLGATAFLVSDYATARDALERMRTMLGGKQRGFLPNGLAVLAETYCDKFGDPVKGEEIARAGLVASPHYANAHFQLGKALVAQGRFADARAAYEAAIDDGKYAAQQYVVDDQVYIWKAHSEIGSTYVMEKNDEKAVEWFDKGLQNSPKAEPLHINRAKALERLERFEEAEAAYRGVYEMYRGAHATIEWVNFLLRRGREDDALRVIDESYGRLPAEMAVPVLMAGAAVCQRRESPEAERYLRAANQLQPGSAEILEPLEALLRGRGKLDDLAALTAAEETVPPRTPLDYLRRSRRAFEAKRYADARALAERGLQIDSRDPRLLYAVAAAQASEGADEAALATIASISEAPADVMIGALLMGASLLRGLRRYDEAVTWVDRALNVDANRADTWLLRADLMEALGADDAFEEALKRAFAVDRRQDVAVRLSGFYLQRQRVEEAVAIASAALE